MDRENIERINLLAKLAKQRALTPEEQKERETRRKAYLAAFKAQARQTLENTKVQYPDGSKVPLSHFTPGAKENK